MLNTLDIKTVELNNVNHTDGAYCVLCNASNIKEKDITALAAHLLSEHELTILQQRKKLPAKKEYIASRFLIKTLISKHLKLPYPQLELRFNSQKKKLQAIFNNQPMAITISLAHSKGMIFFALGDENTTLGVDIEYQNMNRNILSVAEAFFHSVEFKALSQHDYTKFYQLWTLKESLAKATSQSVLALLSQNTMLLLDEYQHALGQYANFQLAAIHHHELKQLPCYLLNLEKLLKNNHE